MPSSALSLLPPSPPLFPYTRSSDLFVVPRSMPTIRDIAFLVLSEGIGQVVDHRAEVRADRQRFLHRREAALPRRGRRSVPVLAERPDEPGLLVPQPRGEAVAVGDERRPADPLEPAG